MTPTGGRGLKSHEESADERQVRLAERAKTAQALHVTKGQMRTLEEAHDRARRAGAAPTMRR